MNSLRPNQLRAIQETVANDFNSGIHYHATGTGKSWIAMHIILKFYEQYPKSNVIWICEKKSILIEQFNRTNLKERNFDHIFQKYNVLNYSENKLTNWYNSVNSGQFWSKPILLIINRAFLTSSEKYKKIKTHFELLIHDECHSIVNKTTRQFYEFMLEQKLPPKCIGFSATPNQTYEPYKTIISSYSIYDAFIDGVVVPPKIKWFSCDDILNYEEIVVLIREQIELSNLPYKKIIVWCGMIELCEKMAKLWSEYFQHYTICMDTCKSSETYGTYEIFDKLEERAILFCAAKHREGSDIKNLDCCVFLDKVENRCPKVFLQCIGRVLRLDKERKKNFGLVIDVRAKSSLVICNHLNQYLNLPAGIFPWSYHYKVHIQNQKLVKINELLMVEPKPKVDETMERFRVEPTVIELQKLFSRKLPENDLYKERLTYELDMLSRKNLICHLMQAMQILHLTKNLPHVTRGSCGSSLVCYMLGISHIDPVKNNIKFARFLTEHRKNLPDIDLDFPHNLRDEVFLKIGLTWPGKIARISNHVYYHDKSAIRQAIRNAGIHKFIGKNEIENELNKLSKETKRFVMKEKENLENTFRCYSLHCGGIVYYPDGIPEELLLHSDKQMNNGALKQITMNKYDISKENNFKIDILSSRALSQCYETFRYKEIVFEEFEYDEKTFAMLHRGDNIGIILGESPLMRKAFLQVRPKDLYGLAVCLSIIRPAAMDARQCIDTIDFNNNIIFDDDAIDMISNYLNIDDESADKYRRAFAKCDKKGIEEFKTQIQGYPREKQKEIMKKLSNLSQYGFCKAHAFSYAQLIWKLAYMKAHYPYEFWKATLNNCVSSYRKWVHFYEAKLAGVDYSKQLLKRDDVSIYAVHRRKKIETYTPIQQLQKYGYWIMRNEEFFPGCYFRREGDICCFNGIIASHRLTKHKKGKKLMLFLGVGKKHYIQLNIENIKYFDAKRVGIYGTGKYTTPVDENCSIVTATKFTYY
jgi:Bacterial DNA polymerase III alpha NTPase domain/Type III restriction enzyme, res subunit/Bacterial DNA polymerase III alpha subunit finger domain